MRELVREFVKLCSEILPIREPIYEFGSLQVEEQKDFADLRSLFPAKRYVGTDMREGPGVDIVLDLHNIGLCSESVGTVLILDTMEHVEFPRKAVEESYRILRKNGVLIMTSVMLFPIHNYPNDYWRFTPEGFRSLLGPFASCCIGFSGCEEFPHTVIGVGFKKNSIPNNIKDKFLSRFKDWAVKWSEIEQEEKHGNAS